MGQFTIVAEDKLYLGFYLKDKDPITSVSTAHTLSGANSITFTMFKEGSTITLTGTMSIIDANSGYCRILMTIPTATTMDEYDSRITVYENDEKITWLGHTYFIKP